MGEKGPDYSFQSQLVWRAAVLLYHEKKIYSHLGIGINPITSRATFLSPSFSFSPVSMNTYGTGIWRHLDALAVWSWFFIVLKRPLAFAELSFDVEDFLCICPILKCSFERPMTSMLLGLVTDERFREHEDEGRFMYIYSQTLYARLCYAVRKLATFLRATFSVSRSCQYRVQVDSSSNVMYW